MNRECFRLVVRCNLVGCSQWMVAGRLSYVGTLPVEYIVSCTRSTGSRPNLSIVCRLLHQQYRWPPSWSCRCCLGLVSSMTSGLVDDVSACLELCEVLTISSTDVHTCNLITLSWAEYNGGQLWVELSTTGGIVLNSTQLKQCCTKKT
jgi:hypothetical protein